jgi:hypothetical protein
LYGELLLHYQFESVMGTPPEQVTPDATGHYISNADPFFGGINLLGGPGTEPGVDYPQMVTGTDLVANSLFKSLNPDSAIHVPAGTSNGRTGVTIADINTGVLDGQLPAFTMAVWVKPLTTDNHRYIAGKFGTSANRGWQFTSPIDSTDLDVFYFGTMLDADGGRRYLLDDVLPLDTWTHVAFTFDGATQTDAVYINGISQTLSNYGSATFVPTQINGGNNQDFWVGHRGATGSTVRGWSGYLDDFRIYTNALSAAEVMELLVPVSASVPGDFNGDGKVDASDYVVWRETMPGDANKYQEWRSNFGYPLGSTAATSAGITNVPEPASIALFLIGLTFWMKVTGRQLHQTAACCAHKSFCVRGGDGQ